MVNNKNRFILKPRFNNMTALDLSYKDQLIYLAIRSFYNSKDKYCYPSYKAIAKKAGVTPKTVSASVKRLRASRLIDVWTIVGKPRHSFAYKFPDCETYQKIPYVLLDIPDLTSFERGMLILLFEYLDEDYTTTKSLSELETASGESYKTLYTQLKSLRTKGYITECYRESSVPNKLEKVISLSEKLRSILPPELKDVRSRTFKTVKPDKSDEIWDFVKAMLRNNRKR